jgi:hypothetical protein
MKRFSRREVLRRAFTTAAAAAVGPFALEYATELTLPVRLNDGLTTLRRIGLESGALQAQWAYHPYQYQQYQMWAQWNALQYQAYMRQMAAQYAWLQAYQAALAQQMQAWYGRGYNMSEPFAMDAVRSVYSYGNGRSGDEMVVGLNRYRSQVEAQGNAARMVSAIQDIGDDEGWDDEDIERAAGPQSSSRRATERVGGRTIQGRGVRTAEGEAFVSDDRFKDENTDRKGNLIVFDSASGKQLRLVPLYG